MSQPLFLTIRVGSLSIEHLEARRKDSDSQSASVGSDYDFGLRLLREPTADGAQSIVWGQRYEVTPVTVEDEDSEEGTSAWSDMGDLMLAPGEKPPPVDNVFPPGTRLCPRKSVVLRSNVSEKVDDKLYLKSIKLIPFRGVMNESLLSTIQTSKVALQ